MKKTMLKETVRSLGVMLLLLVCAITVRYAIYLPQYLH